VNGQERTIKFPIENPYFTQGGFGGVLGFFAGLGALGFLGSFGFGGFWAFLGAGGGLGCCMPLSATTGNTILVMAGATPVMTKKARERIKTFMDIVSDRIS